MLLFHMSSIVLHAHLPSLHRLVRDFSQPKDHTNKITDAIKHWRLSDDAKIVVLHANQLMNIARQMLMPPKHRDVALSSASNPAKSIRRSDEPPHAAICVYLAVIALWSVEVASKPPNMPAAKAILERGCNILARLELRIVTVLLNILRRLEETSEQKF